MRSTMTIDVGAPPELVFQLARDVRRWARLLPHYVRSRAVVDGGDGVVIAEFIACRPLLPLLGFGVSVAWRARTWNEPRARRLHFVHVAGPTKGMDVTWRIEPTDAGSRVFIDHDFRPRLPGLAVFVDRVFTRPIARRTLASFKALAETLAELSSETPSVAAESEAPAGTNSPT